MYESFFELTTEGFLLIVGIFEATSGITISQLAKEAQTRAGAYTTNTEIIIWCCIVFASILLSLALRRWMQANGRRKWEGILWPLILVVVFLLGSCSIVRQSSPPIPETLHSDAVPGQMLAGTRKKNAMLHGVNFQRAMLAGADLRGSDLQSADLRSAMLLGANLSRTNLANANLEGAMLLGANMEGARIDGADFKGAAFLTQEQVDEACGNPKILPEGLRMPQPC